MVGTWLPLTAMSNLVTKGRGTRFTSFAAPARHEPEPRSVVGEDVRAATLKLVPR
jgi:hypothetical protein